MLFCDERFLQLDCLFYDRCLFYNCCPLLHWRFFYNWFVSSAHLKHPQSFEHLSSFVHQPQQVMIHSFVQLFLLAEFPQMLQILYYRRCVSSAITSASSDSFCFRNYFTSSDSFCFRNYFSFSGTLLASAINFHLLLTLLLPQLLSGFF
ncbi:hypothetical protein CW304_04495 [Bacillus sp. UFRGS-B20]|nr:hypothetical protein CW304_04495 [Bacillus sp. UFRGS-B20]